MFFKALACDYDGTLAFEDRIPPVVHLALERARTAGLRLILVTGRTFFELTRVCDCLELFDAVVAENGAVLYYPGSAMIRDQGPPVPDRLLAELDRRGIYYQVGRVIVGTGRGDEGVLKEALAAAGVTRDLIYNRAALMLLPAGVSKGSGVQQALRVLGLSPHDVLALGDAENDLPLFDACGFSGCPADSLPAVLERVDWVFPGVHGAGIAAAITEQILPDRLTVPHSLRHRISIGWVAATSRAGHDPGPWRQHADPRRSAFGQVVAGRRARGAPGGRALLGLRHRSRRGLPGAGASAGRDVDGGPRA